MAKVVEFEFPDGAREECAFTGQIYDVLASLQEAALLSASKIDVNRVQLGRRTVKMRAPSDEARRQIEARIRPELGKYRQF